MKEPKLELSLMPTLVAQGEILTMVAVGETPVLTGRPLSLFHSSDCSIDVDSGKINMKYTLSECITAVNFLRAACPSVEIVFEIESQKVNAAMNAVASNLEAIKLPNEKFSIQWQTHNNALLVATITRSRNIKV